MTRVSREEYDRALADMRQSLLWRNERFQTEPVGLDHAAKWAVDRGITAAQFCSLVWEIGLPEVYRINGTERQIIEAMGRGSVVVEGEGDDLPF